MESNTISEIVDVNIAWKTDFAQNIKINTQDFCIDDFFIINSKIYICLNYKPFMWKGFLTWVILTLWSENVFKNLTVETTQHWQTLVIKDIRF